MGKKTENFELMSTRDVCNQLRISPRTLERYRKRPSDSNPFPAPDCSYIGGSNKWLKTEVHEWQVREMSRPVRRPMAHLNMPRDSKGRITRPDVV
ncbi:TPA: excisionase Xis [Enterobacter cloacae]